MQINNYYEIVEENNEKRVRIIPEFSVQKYIKPVVDYNTPFTLDEIRTYKPFKERFFEDLSWMLSYQKEVQLEAELLSSPILSQLYLDKVARGDFNNEIVVNGKIRNPDFTYHGKFNNHKGVIVEMKSRSINDRILDFKNLEDKTSITYSLLEKTFNVEVNSKQITEYSKFAGENNYFFALLVVNYRSFNYGSYYNSALSLIAGAVEKLLRKATKKDTTGILKNVLRDPASALTTDVDHVAIYDEEIKGKLEELGLEREDIMGSYRKNKDNIHKKIVLSVLEETQYTRKIFKENACDTTEMVAEAYNYLDNQKETLTWDAFNHKGLQEALHGHKIGCTRVLEFPCDGTLVERFDFDIKPNSTKPFIEFAQILQEIHSKFGTYLEQLEESNKSVAELKSNSSKISKSELETGLYELEMKAEVIASEFQTKVTPYNIRVDKHGYFLWDRPLFKKIEFADRTFGHLDIKVSDMTKIEDFYKNLMKNMGESKFFMEVPGEFENPLQDLPSALVGLLYAKRGTDVINKLLNDEVFRYMRLVWACLNQHVIDTPFSKIEDKIDGQLMEWFKLGKPKNLPFDVLSSPDINLNTSGAIMIITYHNNDFVEQDYYLKAELLKTKDGIVRFQYPTRLHPHTHQFYHERLCSYAGEFIFYSCMKINYGDLIMRKAFFLVVNRMLTRFCSHVYLAIQKAPLELTLGKIDMKKEFEGLILNDIRLAYYVKKLRTEYPEYVRKVHSKFNPSVGEVDLDLNIKDPIFGIPINDIQIMLAIINIKQAEPKHDGEIDATVQTEFLLKEVLMNMDLDASNFREGIGSGLNFDLNDNWNRIFRRKPFNSYEECKNAHYKPSSLNKWFDSSTYHPDVMLFGNLVAFDEGFGEENPRGGGRLPLFDSYMSRNTASSVVVPEKYMNPEHKKSKNTKASKAHREKFNLVGFISEKVSEASIDVSQMISDILKMEMYQVTLLDAAQFFKEKYSITISVTKSQREVKKRIFFVQLEGNRIKHILLDESFSEFLKRNSYDLITKPGEKKMEVLEKKYTSIYRKGNTTVKTFDATRFGDAMNIEALKLECYYCHLTGYFNKMEANWMINRLDYLKKRFGLLPKGFLDRMNKIFTKDRDRFNKDYYIMLQYMQNHADVKKFFEEACNEYPGLKRDTCYIKKVGFVLGVFNRLGTVMSTLIGTSYISVMKYLFPNLDVDWATMSDDAICFLGIYSKFKFGTSLKLAKLTELYKVVEENKRPWEVSPDRDKIIDSNGDLKLTYSEFSILSWSLLYLFYKSFAQNISNKKSGQGSIGEILQVYLGWGKAIMCQYKQVVNIGATMNFYSPYEDLMSAMGSVYSLYVSGASSELVSNMFYLISSLVKLVYKIDIWKPFGLDEPFWGPPEITLSYWVMPESISIIGLSGKERLIALYDMSNNKQIKMYKNMFVIIISNGEYVATNKVEGPEGTPKAVTTNREHLSILIVNKLKTKEIFFNSLKHNAVRLIQEMKADIPLFEQYSINIPKVIQSLFFLRTCVSYEIPTDEFNLYKKYIVTDGTSLEDYAKSCIDKNYIENLASTIVKSLTKELRSLIIVGLPKNYIKHITFQNKYLSRSYMLSYNKIVWGLLLRNILGFPNRKYFNYFSKNINLEEMGYNPKKMSTTDVVLCLEQIALGDLEISGLSNSFYQMERDFNRERIDFYKELKINSIEIVERSGVALELNKSWISIKPKLNDGILYYHIKDVMALIVEKHLNKVDDPVLYTVKPNLRYLEGFHNEALYVYKLLTTYGFDKDSIMANYNSLCATLNTPIFPKTVRFVDNKEQFGQLSENFSKGEKLLISASFTKDYVQNITKYSVLDNYEPLRFASSFLEAKSFVYDKKTYNIEQESDRAIMLRPYYYRNFPLWVRTSAITFYYVLHNSHRYVMMAYGPNYVSLRKISGSKVNAKFEIKTNIVKNWNFVIDACVSITKYFNENYDDKFINFRNIATIEGYKGSFFLKDEKNLGMFASSDSNLALSKVDYEEFAMLGQIVYDRHKILLVENSDLEVTRAGGTPTRKFKVGYCNLMFSIEKEFKVNIPTRASFYSKDYVGNTSSLLKVTNPLYISYASLAFLFLLKLDPDFKGDRYSDMQWFTLTAWLYYFDITLHDIEGEEFNNSEFLYPNYLVQKILEVTGKSTIDDEVERDSLEYARTELSKVDIDILDEDIESRVEMIFLTKIGNYQGDLLRFVLSIVMKMNKFKDSNFSRFVRNDIYFKASETRTIVHKRKLANQEVRTYSKRELFFQKEEYHSHEYISLLEMHTSEEAMTQKSYTWPITQRSLYKTLVSEKVNLIQKGVVLGRIADFLIDNTILNIDNEDIIAIN